MAFDDRAASPSRNLYAPVMGRTYVTFDDTKTITVLDQSRCDTLNAWVDGIIPGNEDWPAAREVNAVAYIDATIRKAPELRLSLLAGIDTAELLAAREYGSLFSALDAEQRRSVMQKLETQDAIDAFSVILELTYEAYYRAPAVQDVVKKRTGFNIKNTVQGVPLKPFDTTRLALVAQRPDHYRRVS
ncbi:gluconate 2-dehydrogenase subunit 3 family protein [Arthrobacter ramosus]|uniref:Gluconate 2-dehydrogenase subunit 3 family protein n=1 Tax=Arthrobacter ramosus TaxID=1672 RepID=A0ABV5XVS1_ARTRM|nr:gluconate 2-dehydrogenase subunit 3 family protein [Arthrobacter ramosus]